MAERTGLEPATPVVRSAHGYPGQGVSSARGRFPPTRDGSPQGAGHQSNKSEPLDRTDGRRIGLVTQGIRADALNSLALDSPACTSRARDDIALKSARLKGGLGVRIRRPLVLMTCNDRLVESEFFGRSFHRSGYLA
jgi:hypothetical protein